MTGSVHQVAARGHAEEEFVDVQIVVHGATTEWRVPPERVAAVVQVVGKHRVRARLAAENASGGHVVFAGVCSGLAIANHIGTGNEHRGRRLEPPGELTSCGDGVAMCLAGQPEDVGIQSSAAQVTGAPIGDFALLQPGLEVKEPGRLQPELRVGQARFEQRLQSVQGVADTPGGQA